MKEIWKDINGYEGLYQVSNIGRIKSFHSRYKEPRILKTHKRINGYIFICLHKDKELFTVDIHRLVAEAFVPNPNPDEYKYVLHLDDNQENNVYTNLKWGTQKENCNTKHHHETLSKSAGNRVGEKNPFYGKKHTEEIKKRLSEFRGTKVECDGIIFNSIKECAEYANVNPSSLRRYLRGLQKTLKTTNKNFKLIGV